MRYHPGMAYEPTGFPGAFERRVLWPDHERGPWLLSFWFIELNYRSECVGFEMRSFVKDNETEQEVVAPGPVQPLTATLHRDVAFDAESQRARKAGASYVPHSFLRMFDLDPDQLMESGWGRAEARAIGEADTGRPPGRPRTYGEDHFREVAAVYSAADRRGLHATKAVQDHFAQKWDDEVTRSQAAKWVHRARHEFGLLKPTEPRQQGGGLTPEDTEDER